MQNRSIQTSPFAAELGSDTLSWTEQFNTALPWNFFTSASYRLLKDTRAKEETAREPRKEDTSETESANFTLAHKLYDSVRTAYALSQTSSRTSSGDTKSLANAVNGIYTKRIPDGRVTIGVQGSRTAVTRANAPLVLGEMYTAPLFGTFTLSREDSDPATVSISALSNINALVGLVRDVHYVVESFGNTTIITIVSLPAEIIAGQPADNVYPFQVTYALSTGSVVFETTNVGYSINLSLFENLVSPYYSHQHTAQTVLTGSIPGGAQDTDTVILGVAVQKAPYAFVSEYQTTESDVSPAHSLRNSAEYVRKVSDTLGLSAKAQHVKTVYGEGTLGTSGFTEQLSAINLVLNKNVPRKDLNASLTASYSQRNATVNTDLYSITGSLLWKIGTLSLNLGSSLNHAVSTGAIGKQTVLSEYYYMTVSRKLF
jgi:hypothetical protein